MPAGNVLRNASGWRRKVASQGVVIARGKVNALNEEVNELIGVFKSAFPLHGFSLLVAGRYPSRKKPRSCLFGQYILDT